MGGSPPKPPDYEEAAKQGVYADLETYPLRYLTEAASKTGGKVTVDGKTYDFTGLGDADNAAVMSDKMAQTLLDIQRAKGPEFIAQRIAELKQADPKGYAARKDLFDRIMAQAQAQPNRPLAGDLQTSIMGELQRAGRLDARELEQVQQAVRGGQVSRGNYLGTAATTQEADAAVKAREALRDQEQTKATGFLESGVTPEDVQYRRLQQSLGNLGHFIEGQTPTAEFKSLSSAGTGATPFVGGGSNSQVTNPNAAAMGLQNALDIYRGNVNWSQSQVNPWVAGISTGLSAASAGAGLGLGRTTTAAPVG
jgi:hypothetical protein